MHEETIKFLVAIYRNSRAIEDAEFHGVSEEVQKGIRFTLNKILEETGYTFEDVITAYNQYTERK